MLIGIPRETHRGERRVAATPETARRLMKLAHQVVIESGAGEMANFPDAMYEGVGVPIAEASAVWSRADLVLKVRAPEPIAATGRHEADLLRDGGCLACFVWPAQNGALLERLASKRVTTLAMDCIPRIARAQKMDALSSMANIAGYRAVIEAAHHFGRFFAGQVTAAGSTPPAKVLVIGAGVAGLAAIRAAVSLGAMVRAFDTRPEVKDQVRSVGAEFLELARAENGTGEGGYARVMSEAYIAKEMELFAQQAMEVDVVVTTALVPGREAPKLITSGMVESMKEGSVIVDMAAAQGGNCALTEPGRVVVRKGVTIIGYTDLPSRVPTQSSQLYGTNLYHLVEEITRDGKLALDLEDDAVRAALVTHEGRVTWPPPPPKTPPPKPAVAYVEATKTHGEGSALQPARSNVGGTTAAVAAAATLLGLVGLYVPPAFLQHLTVFVLACFVGWQVIWNVTPALHTPLMSVTNAISGIIVIGALLQVTGADLRMVNLLAALAIFLATINVAGGFAVTHRMLRMFRK